MSNLPGESLSKAFRLIEADELGAARAILQPILADEPNNVDAWWLYAHAVTDTGAAHDALNNVLRLDPNYPGATELLHTLNTTSVPAPAPAITRLAPVAPSVTLPDAPPELPVTLPDADDDLDDLPDLDSERGSPLPRLAVVAGIIIVLLLLALLLTRGSGDVPPATDVANEPTTVDLPAQVAGSTEDPTGAGSEVATDEAPTTIPVTLEPIIATELVGDPAEPTDAAAPTDVAVVPAETESIPTNEAITATESIAVADVTGEPAAAGDDALMTALAGFDVRSIDRATTGLGDTLLVSICTTAGQPVREALPQVMSIIADQTAAAGDAEAVGTRMVNCESNRDLLVIAVLAEEAALYAEGGLTDEEFQTFWQPQ